MFSLEQIQNLTTQTSLETVRCLDSVDSTNDAAKSICNDPQLKLPSLVIARNQTRGRGRGKNSWLGGEGALTFSLIHDAEELRAQLAIDQRHHSVVALWTALGVRAGLRDVSPHAPSERFTVKWPNDVYADDRKIAGILIETVSRPVPRMVMGIGINVNNRPPDLAAASVPATSLQQIIGAKVELIDVLLAVLGRLDQRLGSGGKLPDAWAPHCFLTGRPVCTPDASGICEGVSDDGALRVRTDDGIIEVRSGAVTWQR